MFQTMYNGVMYPVYTSVEEFFADGHHIYELRRWDRIPKNGPGCTATYADILRMELPGKWLKDEFIVQCIRVIKMTKSKKGGKRRKNGIHDVAVVTPIGTFPLVKSIKLKREFSLWGYGKLFKKKKFETIKFLYLFVLTGDVEFACMQTYRTTHPKWSKKNFFCGFLENLIPNLSLQSGTS